MSNIADMIESYILRQLATRQDGQVELRRTDIADEISCAPSQISYVLSTRFTQDKGFVVESRRGLGGFIRIVQVPLRDLVYQDMLSEIDEDTDMETVQSMVRYLAQHGMIETREAALLMQVVTGLFHSETLAAKERVQMLRTMLLTLENFTYQGTEVPENYLANSGREMNREYKDQLINKVVMHYGIRLFLPMDIRSVITTVKSFKYLWH